MSLGDVGGSLGYMYVTMKSIGGVRKGDPVELCGNFEVENSVNCIHGVAMEDIPDGTVGTIQVRGMVTLPLQWPTPHLYCFKELVDWKPEPGGWVRMTEGRVLPCTEGHTNKIGPVFKWEDYSCCVIL